MIACGNFVTLAINFLIVEGGLFLVVKGINRVRLQEAQQPSAPPLSRQEKLLEDIRDLLASTQ